MIAHQHMGVHLPPSHYYSTNGMMMHHSYPTNAYGALPHLTAPYGHRSEQRMHSHLSNKGGYGAAGYYAPAAQMHASYAHQAQAQAQAQAHQEYYAREQQLQQRAALLGASGDNNRHEMGLVYNHNGNAALPEHSHHHHHHHSSRNGNGVDNSGGDGDGDDDDGRAAHATTSSSDLNEERAHLDRLFSALAAAHPHPHPNPGLSHSSNGLSNGYNGAAGNGAATGGNANGYSQSELALGRSYAARMNSNEQVQQQQQARHPLWASTGLAQGYAHQATHQLSLPPPSYPPPHQGTGLQPAFDFGPTQLPGLPSSLFSVTDREVEHNLAVSAGRYDQSLAGQERREQAVLLHEQAKRNEVAAAAAWADYAVQQQKQSGQNHMQAHEQARALTQQELAEVILPGKEFTLDDEPQLIPTDASAIPPPPPIEKSAHPLAALATDLVWEAFLSAASSNSAFPHLGTSPSVPSSGSQSPMYLPHQHGRGNGSDSDSGMFLGSAGNGSSRTSPLPGYGGSVSTHLGASVTMPRTPGNISSAKKSHVRSTSKSLSPSSHGVIGRAERATSVPRGDAETPGTGNVYGAIGGERRPRHGSTLATRHDASPGSRSDSSSPASTAPGTPASSSATANCIVKTSSETSLGAKMSKRLSGGLPWASSVVGGGNGEDVDSFSNANKDIYQAGLLKNPLHYQQGQTQAQQQQAYQRFAHHLSPPMSLFEQIQKLLGATLLSQQVLLLALYFVAKTPHTCPLYPPATSQSALKSTSAPFKLLLAALVVANKHLDDNSFRNSTFAQVANVTLPEVNALEFSMLSSLDFDINVASSDWLAWLRDLQYQRTTRFTHDQAQVVNVENIITPLVEGVVAHQKEHARLFFKSEPTSQGGVDSSSNMTLPRVNSTADIAMIPFSPEEHDENFSSFANASFDMDASGPLEAEQRPQYSKAFGAAPIPVGNPFKQHQNTQQSAGDEPMYFTSGYMDEDLSQNQNGYSDWDMPEDPYASHVRF